MKSGPFSTRRDVDSGVSPWRFSLAGVALKFSMLAKGDRLTVPAAAENGDWLVKFPDQRFAQVPRNEFVMMSMAREVGIEVPDVRLVHRDELVGLPDRMWPNSEEWAYAVRRFDRGNDPARTPVHIEDFAQVRDKYPDAKYEGTFETVAALSYRGHNLAALREMVRRLAFNVIIGNGDAHLKNWSLIYRDRRHPTLSPAYDLVSTVTYGRQGGHMDDLGLKLGGNKRFEKVRLSSFGQLEDRLSRRFGPTGAGLQAIAVDIRARVPAAWEQHRSSLADSPGLATDIDDWIHSIAPRLDVSG
ncbi:serine/threonine-protein kinase HipA [Frankia sp. AiPs1]